MDGELVENLSFRIEDKRIGYARNFLETSNFADGFVPVDRKVLEFRIGLVLQPDIFFQMGHFIAADAAPGRRELQQDYLATQVGQFAEGTVPSHIRFVVIAHGIVDFEREVWCFVAIEDDVIPLVSNRFAGFDPAQDAAVQVHYLGKPCLDQFPGSIGTAFAAPAVDGDGTRLIQTVQAVLHEGFIIHIEQDCAWNVFFCKFFRRPHIHQLDIFIGDGRLEIIRSNGLEFRTATA